ncbi:MAG TPA: hypothetical protein VGF14_03545 [Alphaproteobacteria bacterium]
MSKRLFFAFFVMLFSAMLTAACDGPKPASKTGDLAQYSSAETAPESVDDNDAAIPILPPNTDRIYTYLGGLIIRPDLYAKTPTGKVDDLQLCGYVQPDKSTQKICAKYSDMYGHLYDYDHIGLDIWDVRGNWYLALARSGLQEIWMEHEDADFRAYPDLVKSGLTFMGDWNYIHDPAWPTKSWAVPQGTEQSVDHNNLPKNASANPMIQLLEAKIMPDKDVWFKVNFTNNVCDGNNNVVLANIWYPAYRAEGRLRLPNFWFYSKGC